MCGIAGIFHYQDFQRPVDRDLLLATTRTLAHRGPDGEGIWSEGPAGLGHRRLSILDLSDAASQPMTDETNRFVITFNGEIYNFQELRSLLERSGHRFRSTGDTEVVLTGYKEWGRDVVQRISGIYAFAIWDSTDKTLFLARDPLGVKPLFYSLAGDSFRFGSEIKALLRDPAVDRRFNFVGLDAFLTFGYTPAPRTGFESVSQLQPGHTALVSGRGVEFQRFWQSPYTESEIDLSPAEAESEFTALLDRITGSQMISDVGVGAFLSGGLDSAAIVRSMIGADAGPVRAFGVGLDWHAFNEIDRARQTAQALGVDFSDQIVGLADAGILADLSRHLEEPTADSSCLPMYLLCKQAVQHFKVAMSGDGADEILAGYGTYSATLAARYYRMLPGFVRRKIISPLAALIPRTNAKYPLEDIVSRFLYGAELGPGLDHSAWRVIFNDPMKDCLYAEEFRSRVTNSAPLQQYADYIEEVPAARGTLAGLLHADTSFYLPNDMLVKVDRMSMANGLEVRVPFLDVDMVRYCASLPNAYKLRHGHVRKHVLRESLRESVPGSILRAPKSGFNIPVDQWMRGYLREMLFDSLESVRDDLAIFLQVNEVKRLADEHRSGRNNAGHVLFVVMMFCLWLHNVANAWKPETAPRRPEEGVSP
jgi:asparagine synthase (glutamine-hydrolysing)